MTEQELTPKELAMRNLETTLYQHVFSSNNYEEGRKKGKVGLDSWMQGAYDGVTGSEEFVNQREEFYRKQKKKYEAEEIFGEPAMPTNADIARDMIMTVRRSLEMITLSDLYNVMTSIDPAVKEYKLPGFGGEISTKDIYEEAKKKGAIIEKDGKEQLDIEKLSPKLQEALVSLETLKKMYEDSCKEKLRRDRREAYFKMASEQRNKEFHPEEEAQAA